MLVVRMGDDLGVMGSVIVAKHALSFPNVGIGVMHADRMSEFSANNFIEVEVGIVPEDDPASDESIVVVRCKAGDWLLDFANVDVLAQATFDSRKIVVDNHAGIGFFCINWRTGSEVK